MLTVAILAGGLATRLKDVSNGVPKSLVKVAGKPFIFYQLENLYSQNVRQIVICVGHGANEIINAVGDGSFFGLNIKYSFDGPNQLGTLGAVKNALPLLGENFFVMYGDTLLAVDFNSVLQTYIKAHKKALMTIFENNGKWDASNVLFDGCHLKEYSKRAPSLEMRHIDYGLSVLSADLFQINISNSTGDLGDLFSYLAKINELGAFVVNRRFYEIGTPESLSETEKYIKQNI